MKRRLFAFERAWVRATLDAIYPAAACEALPQGIATSDVDGFFEDLFVHVPLAVWLGLRIAIWVCALAPLVLLRRLATITMLSPGDRVVVIRRLASSKRYAVRQLVTALKAAGGFLYAGSPAVRARVLDVGHPPTLKGPTLRLRLPLLTPETPASKVQGPRLPGVRRV